MLRRLFACDAAGVTVCGRSAPVTAVGASGNATGTSDQAAGLAGTASGGSGTLAGVTCTGQEALVQPRGAYKTGRKRVETGRARVGTRRGRPGTSRLRSGAAREGANSSSLASETRRGGQFDDDTRPTTGRTLDFEGAVDDLSALAHPDETETPPQHLRARTRARGQVESTAVIGDRQNQQGIPTCEMHVRVSCARVLRDVVERFLDHSIQMRLDVGIHPEVLEAGA